MRLRVGPERLAAESLMAMRAIAGEDDEAAVLVDDTTGAAVILTARQVRLLLATDARQRARLVLTVPAVPLPDHTLHDVSPTGAVRFDGRQDRDGVIAVEADVEVASRTR